MQADGGRMQAAGGPYPELGACRVPAPLPAVCLRAVSLRVVFLRAMCLPPVCLRACLPAVCRVPASDFLCYKPSPYSSGVCAVLMRCQ